MGSTRGTASFLLHMAGSAFPRVLPPVLFSGALTTALVYSGQHQRVTDLWVHPYAYSIFAAILSFILVFRAQYGYNRYWEARTYLQQMTARMTEAATMILAFDRHTLPPGDSAALAASAEFTSLVLHLCSLLHAICCQGLRRDPNLGNLVAHTVREPPLDPQDLAAKSATTPHPSSMVGRVRLTDMFVLRGSAPALAQYNAAQPLPVIGGISTAEWTALACALTEGQPETLAWPSSVGGRRKNFARTVNTSCCAIHCSYMDRPHIVASWLQEVLVKRKLEGGLAVASPVLARVYQLLSEVMSGYEHCRKIADTPFPFPWAQFMIVVLLMFTISFPLLVVGFVRNNLLSIFMTVVTVGTYWATSEVAREIEDPFFLEPNSLPLAHIQFQLNHLLLNLATSNRPPSNHESGPPPHRQAALGHAGSGGSPFNPNPFAAPASPSASAAARRKATYSYASTVAAGPSMTTAAEQRSPPGSPAWGQQSMTMHGPRALQLHALHMPSNASAHNDVSPHGQV